MVHLSDRVVRPPVQPEPVGDRQKVGLEDRFQHQLQRRLDDPIRHRGNAELAYLARPTRFRDRPLTDRARGELPGLDPCAQIVQKHPDTDLLFDVGDRAAVHPGSAGPGVARDPIKRHLQRRGIADEIEQVVEPAARIGRRPTMKLGLHPQYPPLNPPRRRPRRPRRRASPRPARRHSATHLLALQPPHSSHTAAALPHVHGLSPARSTTAAPPRPGPIGRQWTQPHPAPDRASPGRGPERFPCSLVDRSMKEEPGSASAASPQVRRRPSSWPPGPTASRRPRSSPTTRPSARRVRTATSPYPSDLSWWGLRRLYTTGSSRTPLHHAHRTHAI